MFRVHEQRLEGPGLALRFHLAPWDHAVLGAETAAISALLLRDATRAEPTWSAFREWCTTQGVALVSARLAHHQIAECAFLEARGFRFIELNYRPVLSRLSGVVPDPAIRVGEAGPTEETAVREIAGRIFEAGRLHMDPMVGPEIGNRRYAAWAANAFRNPAQRVLTCTVDGQIAAFLVVESPTPECRFWSLLGLAPGLAGRGLGRRTWQAALAHHAAEGVTAVETSISSHNVAMHNLCVSLGFRFPEPFITLHWCPQGTLVR